MRFGSSPQLTDVAQNQPRRTILPFAAATPTPAVIGRDPSAIMNSVRQLRDVSAAGPDPVFTPPDPAPPDPAPQAPGLQPKALPATGISDAVRLGTDLFGQVGQKRLAPELALKDFADGLGSLNISRAAAAKLTETFAVALQKAVAAGRAPIKATAAPAGPVAARPDAPHAALDPETLLAVVPPSGEPAGGPGITPSRTETLQGATPAIETDRPIPDVLRSPVPPGVSPPKADEFLQVRHDDPVSFVRTAPRVEDARAAFESNPTTQTSVRLSRELIEAQLQRSVPADSLTPLTDREARQWAQSVLNVDVDRRREAIRELAIQMQRDHGEHADLALKAIARHWAEDASSTAFAGALIELLDDTRVLPRVTPQGPEGDGLRVPPGAGPFPALGTDPSRAGRLADLNRTPASVRDAEGNFLRGAPLGEAVHVGNSVGIREPDGTVRLTDQNRHVVLFDEESERWLVFNRTFLNDTFDRPLVAPFLPGGVRNDRTGESSTGLSETVNALLNAIMLPGDVDAGLVASDSDQITERAVEFAETVSPTTAVRAVRQLGTRAAPRATDRDPVMRALDEKIKPVRRDGVEEPEANLGVEPSNAILPLSTKAGMPIVKVKTKRLRSSNAVKGTPEWEMLNDPKPNTIYELDNGETFGTNEFGLTRQLRYEPSSSKRGRDNRQTEAGKDGLDNDVGGHLRGCFSDGTCDAYNMIAQNENFNNGLYREWENVIRRNIDNVDAIKITVERKVPSTARPDGLRVEWVVDGVRFCDAFKNRHGGR